MRYLAVAFGGAVGSLLRYSISNYLYSRMRSPSLPYATILINIVGSLLIGMLTQLFDARVSVSPAVRVGVIAGFLGGFTTFSSFSLETYTLIQEGAWGMVLLNTIGSVVLGILACFAGIKMVQ